MIAEDIIAGYYRIRDFLKDARNQFLKRKNKVRLDFQRRNKASHSHERQHQGKTEMNKQATKIFVRQVG